MKNFIKKIIGLDKLENEVKLALQNKLEAEEAAAQALEKAHLHQEASRIAEIKNKLGPKEAANARKEPYVAVLQTHVNDQNPRNGFFELDWNEYFIVQLKADGYFGDTDEEVVDKWWREICRNVATEEGFNMDRRGSGYINVNRLGDGKSEIS
jgi:hypothetical protein